jgi:hypothetical protein
MFIEYWVLCIIILVLSEGVLNANPPHYHLVDATKVFMFAWLIVPVYTVGALLDVYANGFLTNEGDIEQERSSTM